MHVVKLSLLSLLSGRSHIGGLFMILKGPFQFSLNFPIALTFLVAFNFLKTRSLSLNCLSLALVLW